MELWEWEQADIEALAKVYIKRKELRRANAVRIEIAARLRKQSENKDNVLEQLYADLDESNVISMTDRIAGFAEQTTALFRTSKRSA